MYFPTTTLLTGIIAGLAAVASAQSGNPITVPAAKQINPAGKPFDIKWEPTTEGKVSITLWKGATTNLQSITNIAENIDNSGTYTWTPPKSLAKAADYALKLDAADGSFQYSSQFEISEA
ncbi:Cell wall beta-glucan synthesis [Neofusicoccum parvum]|uniref:Cell wall beta-glucan synthesis n=2 Tax=Neofusicoccum parvum TaxID=310453 RepID=A0ACB5SH08_9PEZI|nr:putative gpi anchored serine-threonine rich protein [Neofusicoccum parvum UCRNP2]GME34260.1 Cell wall beta-glucan synthesis [Neofusicoccum parvum]GME40166.1 Cell wall beta-glucan synthesis [Neofusicoccum parvum]